MHTSDGEADDIILRTLYQAERVINIQRERKGMKLDLQGLGEIGWPGAGCEETEGR